MRVIVLALAFAGTLLMGGCTYHQSQKSMDPMNTEARLDRYMNSPAMLRQMADHAVDKDKKLGRQPDCEIAAMGKVHTIPATTIDFPEGSEHPLKGQWRAVYSLNRCGQNRLHNVRFQARSGDMPSSEYLFTGMSFTDDRLMKDAFGSALLAVMASEPQPGLCSDFALYQTAIVQRPTKPPAVDGSFVGIWKENWTIRICGKLRDVVMRFESSSNGQGTTFSAKAAKPANSP